MNDRSGIACGGNWIVDRVKTVDRLPGRGMLGNIRSQESSTGGAAANVLFDLARMKVGLPLTGVGVISFSPLGAGFLAGKYRQGGPVPAGTRFDVIPGHQNLYFTETGWRVMEGLRTKAASMGVSMITLALAWAMGERRIASVLVGARRPEHVDQALEAKAFGMSPELREELSRL